MRSDLEWCTPGWGIPGVFGGTTTRRGGFSAGPWSGLNLGLSSGDDADSVRANRELVNQQVLSGEPAWMKQVHGCRVIHLDEWHPGIEADGAWTDRPGQVPVVLTADCLPVLLADVRGRVVAAIHAGWRGLAAGILEGAVDALPVAPDAIRAWIGPAIRQSRYQVGEEVVRAFPGPAESRFFQDRGGGHWLADLPGIAARRLADSGVGSVEDCMRCAAREPESFFSYRRDGPRSGRMATLIRIRE